MLRRFAFLAVPVILVACGGSSNESAFNEPAPDTGTSSDDSSTADSGTVIEEDGATITDTDVPPPDDTGTTPTDTGTELDTGSPIVDTGVLPVDTGVPPTDGGVACPEAGSKTYMGHCYFPISSRTFDGARSACAAAGAHLVTITSAGEQTLVNTVGTGERWIGLARFSGSTSFRWVTMEAMTYTNWAAGEPNGSGYCARLRTDGWADISCSQYFPAVCERE
jgi:hypothetical protein